MAAPRLNEIERCPRARFLRDDAAKHRRGLSPERIETFAIDILADRLSVACSVFFHRSRAIDARVSSILDHDLFIVSVMSLHDLQEPAIRSRHPAAWVECLDLIERLLEHVATKREHPRVTVKRELVAAQFLACALFNEHAGRALQSGLSDSEFLCDELYAVVRATSLQHFVDDVRRGLPDLG